MTDYAHQNGHKNYANIHEMMSNASQENTTYSDKRSMVPQNVVKRPTTAGVARSIFSKNQSQERLASNQMLRDNSLAKQQMRRQMFLRGFSGKSRFPKDSNGVLTTSAGHSPKYPN